MGGLISGIFGLAGENAAANAQEQAAQTAANAQLQMFNIENQEGMPWLQAGGQALGQQAWMLGLAPPPAQTLTIGGKKTTIGGAPPGGYQGGFGQYSQPFTQQQMWQDPGYNMTLQQQQQGIQAAAASAGNYGGGNMANALQQNAYGLSSQEYANAYGRWMNVYNNMAGVSGKGQQQSGYLGNMAMGTGNALSNIAMNQGNSLAAIYQSMGNTAGTAVQNMQNMGMSMYGLQNQYNMMNQFMNMNQGQAGLYPGSPGYGDAGMGYNAAPYYLPSYNSFGSEGITG